MPIARACPTRDDYASLREKLASRPTSVAGSAIAVCISCREGIMIIRKKTQRLYKKEGLAVRRAAGGGHLLRRLPCRTSAGAWSWARFACPSPLRYESVHDQMASGWRFRVLNSWMTGPGSA